ncbi:MAG TPA: hypothetical protein VGC46_15810 [Allosphingosinicella sp.]
MTAALVLALALLQAQQPAASAAPRPSLPFESGEVRVVNRANRAGEADCSVTAADPAWRSYGEATCRRLIRPWPGPAVAAPVRESTMVIGLAAGSVALAEPTGRGTIAVDQEAEVTIAADGSVGQCRPLREASAAPLSERARICGGLMREGPGLFAAAPGTPERRARLRITYFSWDSGGAN